MANGKNNVGAIKYSTTLNTTTHPLDTIENQIDLGVTVHLCTQICPLIITLIMLYTKQQR